jgi:2-keto-4-pentenoate hydratase/2-oxohepta-3-ene-1,7-dioic acid hydratase in catechol pathway
MRFARVASNGAEGVAIATAHGLRVLFGGLATTLEAALASTGDLAALGARIEAEGTQADASELTFLPPVVHPPKIICLGLNYRDHAAEGGFTPPDFPTLFARFASSLIGHGAPMVLPPLSDKFDYEGELVAVLGKGGKNIAPSDALAHVAAYSIFNDGSLRDYQTRTPQWTAGKNFDGTGAFGPFLVTPDELPPGAAGLTLETRLNGQVVQHANTTDMIFDVASTIHLLSTFLSLEAGDVLVMGTPAGVGFARKPPLWMKDGDTVEVEIERLGVLRNPVKAAVPITT